MIFWADTEGAYAGLSVGASDITSDEDANRAYYGRTNVSPNAVLNGTISKARPETAALKAALGEA